MTSYAIAEELSLATKMLLISSKGRVINLIMGYHHRWHLVNVATRWQKHQLTSRYYAKNEPELAACGAMESHDYSVVHISSILLANCSWFQIAGLSLIFFPAAAQGPQDCLVFH